MKTKIYKMIILFLFGISNICFADSTEKKLKDSTFVIKEVLDVLQSKSRDTFLNLYPEFYHDDIIADQYSDYDVFPDEAIIHWYSYRDFFYYLSLKIKYESNDVLKTEKLSKKYLSWDYGTETLTITCEPYFMTINSFNVEKNCIIFNINSMCKLENKFKLNEIQYNEWEHNAYNAKMIFDGNYIDLFINDTFIHQFCYVNQETLHQYYNVIQNNTCDLSKVTWPRHADGTSEYDNKIIIPQPIVLFEDENIHDQLLETSIEQKDEVSALSKYAEPRTVMVKKNNEMVIAENSIIRMNPDSNGTYMTSVVKGAKVKILKIGKKETINNVTSNWVLINFVGDAYNEKGKKIYYKTEGWIFGGYLE